MESSQISVHHKVVNLLTLFNLKSDKLGVCYGLAGMAMQAIQRNNLAKEKDVEYLKFNKIIAMINELGELFRKHPNQVKNTLAQLRLLQEQKNFSFFATTNPKDRKPHAQVEELLNQLNLTLEQYLDLLAFAQGVDLYFQNDNYAIEQKGLFPPDKASTVELASVARLLNQEPTTNQPLLNVSKKQIACGSLDDLGQFFMEFHKYQKAFSQKNSLADSTSFVICYSNHAILVNYNHKLERFELFDPNQKDCTIFLGYQNNEKIMQEQLSDFFKINHSNKQQNFIFDVEMICPTKSCNNQLLEDFKKSSVSYAKMRNASNYLNMMEWDPVLKENLSFIATAIYAEDKELIKDITTSFSKFIEYSELKNYNEFKLNNEIDKINKLIKSKKKELKENNHHFIPTKHTFKETFPFKDVFDAVIITNNGDLLKTMLDHASFLKFFKKNQIEYLKNAFKNQSVECFTILLKHASKAVTLVFNQYFKEKPHAIPYMMKNVALSGNVESLQTLMFYLLNNEKQKIILENNLTTFYAYAYASGNEECLSYIEKIGQQVGKKDYFANMVSAIENPLSSEFVKIKNVLDQILFHLHESVYTKKEYYFSKALEFIQDQIAKKPNEKFYSTILSKLITKAATENRADLFKEILNTVTNNKFISKEKKISLMEDIQQRNDVKNGYKEMLAENINLVKSGLNLPAMKTL